MWWILAILIFLGVIFLIMETLLLPGMGISGILGLLSLGGACWYAYSIFDAEVGRWVTIGVIVLVVIMVALALRKKTWSRFALKDEIDSKVNVAVEQLSVGDCGIAQTRLAPMGTARFANVSCEVKSMDNSMIDAGTQIEVVALEDGKAIVKTINN